MKNKNLILGIALAILGLLLLIIPSHIFKVVLVALGAISVVNGILILHTERALLTDSYYRTTTLIRGIASIVIGILVVCFPLKFGEAMWIIACYGLGIWLVVSSFLEIFGIIQLHRNDIEFKTYLMETFVSFIIAIVLFVLGAKGFSGVNIILRTAGGIILLSGALLIIIAWKNKPVYVEAENVETIKEEEATQTKPETSESEGEE